MSWTDLSTGLLDADDPPLALIWQVIRSNQRASGFKPIPRTYTTGGSTGATSYTTMKSYYIYIPTDAPSSSALRVPLQLEVNNTPAYVRCYIDSSYSQVANVDPGPITEVFSISVDTSWRGQEKTLVVEGYLYGRDLITDNVTVTVASDVYGGQMGLVEI